ncbi:hypothetical protein [Aeromicrobium terrae]|uniref:DUF2567 domain-containing protein n=1 Tax=Aeromicrobium terrae TaxID=2498846 RepID=A0A5C8NLX4_9ACTN|nr:hypothetical protein [Aeromicrobium terrae]TXL62854.1 hypothetical protein FHP06_00995 [Aeromicrobium terrae]
MPRLIRWSGGMLVLGVVGGLLWVWQADPAEWSVTKDGILLSEDAVRGQFSVVVTFMLVGAALSFLWAWAAAHAMRDVGWVRVPAFAVAAALAALVAWRLGVWLGPSGPEHATDPAIGDHLASQLKIDAVTPFLAWPVFALLGLLWDSWLQRPDDADTEVSEQSEPSHRG